MKQIFISHLNSYEGEEVILRGWVANIRSSGKIFFLLLRDGSGFAQCIAEESSVSVEVWQNLAKLTLETSVEISGLVKKHPKKDEYELQLTGLKIYQVVADYPIANKEHGTEFLMDNRHLWLRSSKQWATQRVRNTIINAIYQYLNQEGFIKIDAPILTPTACEGTTTLFEVPYFDQKAYLSQSGQLYIEAAIFSVGRCFDFGPVFRAEKSKTRRHLNEFWMMDAEAAFVQHLENMTIQEGLVCHIVEEVLKNNRKELEILERDFSDLEKVKAPFYRMTHEEAVKTMKEMGLTVNEDGDFGVEEEIGFVNKFDRPVFVEKYPAKIKAFYMKRDAENSELALCSDLLAPGIGEIIGGSEREDNYEILRERLVAENLSLDDFSWYLDLRKYGSVPHSGFGIGLERTVSWICGSKHVRETIPFPRLLNRLRP